MVTIGSWAVLKNETLSSGRCCKAIPNLFFLDVIWSPELDEGHTDGQTGHCDTLILLTLCSSVSLSLHLISHSSCFHLCPLGDLWCWSCSIILHPGSRTHRAWGSRSHTVHSHEAKNMSLGRMTIPSKAGEKGEGAEPPQSRLLIPEMGWVVEADSKSQPVFWKDMETYNNRIYFLASSLM